MTFTILALLTLLLDSARDPRGSREPRPKATTHLNINSPEK
jgi:hypothetical protein